ncbi:MAG TPA: hypothetical protein VFL14_11945 [Xanthomonadales bacterium]|nr:hypothetical protein [Xanthomonadales bacterium]
MSDALARARAAFAAGRQEEALRLAEAAGAIPEALALAANAALALRAWERAIPPLEQLLLLTPRHEVVARMLSTAHNNLGARALREGRSREAAVSFSAALAAWDANTDALFNMARLALDARRPSHALPWLRRLHALKPDDAQVALELVESELAVAQEEEIPGLLPRLRDAARAARIDPMRVAAALSDAGIVDDGLAAVRSIASTDAFQSGLTMAFRLSDNAQVDAARAAWSHLAAIGGRGKRAPSLVACIGERLALPPVYDSVAALEAQRTRFAAGLEQLHAEFDDAALARCAPSLEQLRWTNFLLAYQGHDDRALQERYASFVARAAQRFAPSLCAPPARRAGAPRVGLFSSAFRHSTVGSYFGSWAGAIARAGFDTTVFQLGPSFDDTTEAIGRAATRLVKVPDGPVAGIAELVREHALDLLVYPDPAVDARIVPLTSLRLARVQAAAWGHPVTTGSSAIDAIFGCAAMETPDAQSHYTERLLLLPGIGTQYARPAAPARVDRDTLGLPAGRLYLVPQSLFKLHPESDDVLARIAAEDREARILLYASERPGAVRVVRERLSRALRAAGADPATQLRFLPLVTRSRFLEICAACDVMVDTPHWSGGNTAIDALVSGLPVVAQPGRFMRGRQSTAMLGMLGLDGELVARDPAEQVRIALRAATDHGLRARIAERIDVLFEGNNALDALVRHVEALIAQ